MVRSHSYSRNTCTFELVLFSHPTKPPLALVAESPFKLQGRCSWGSLFKTVPLHSAVDWMHPWSGLLDPLSSSLASSRLLDFSMPLDLVEAVGPFRGHWTLSRLLDLVDAVGYFRGHWTLSSCRTSDGRRTLSRLLDCQGLWTVRPFRGQWNYIRTAVGCPRMAV
jgi:hypothetical protein